MLFIFCKNGRCVLAQLSPAFNIIYTQTPHTHIQKLVVPSSAVCASYRQVMRQHVAHVAKSENLISASIQHHSLVLLGPCFNFAAGSGVGSPLRYIWCWNSPNPQSLSYIFDASSKLKKKKKRICWRCGSICFSLSSGINPMTFNAQRHSTAPEPGRACDWFTFTFTHVLMKLQLQLISNC